MRWEILFWNSFFQDIEFKHIKFFNTKFNVDIKFFFLALKNTFYHHPNRVIRGNQITPPIFAN